MRSASDRRFFGTWKERTTRQYLYLIVKKWLKATFARLEPDDRILVKEMLRISPHWMRHTFAKAALLHGQSMREVATLLGHTSTNTTMVYADQSAIDSVQAFERDNVGVAREG